MFEGKIKLQNKKKIKCFGFLFKLKSKLRKYACIAGKESHKIILVHKNIFSIQMCVQCFIESTVHNGTFDAHKENF